MENEEFLRLCKAKVAEYTNSHMDVTDRQQVTVHDVYVVWSCKTLQNNKALLSTTVPDAPYVEFGTGPKGQANHAGISPEVTPVYTQVPWWIHESQVDRRTAEKYRWFYIDIPQGRFYQCTGQPAHPFLYPALHDNEDKILKNMKASFQADIGKESK